MIWGADCDRLLVVAEQRLQAMMKYVTGKIGQPTKWSRDPDKLLLQLERLVQANLLQDETGQQKRVAFLFDHGQYLLPDGDLSMLARGQASRLVRFIGWAQNPYIKKVNMAFCLITDKLSELNERLVQNPHVATIEIPLPTAETRKQFVEQAIGENETNLGGGLTLEGIAQLSSGLNLTSLDVTVSRVRQKGHLDPTEFRNLKKTMIERQCQGLVSFLEPEHTLDLVVGHDAAKARLEQDGQWVSEGRLDAAPMGYLMCGPVGTGKTFMAECYAGSIGIPCVTLKNFRSKYVGETEGNLEHVLNVLRSLGPVVVIIDEADAALGTRLASGDSGTSGRVFSMIASQMGNTRYRGKIIWMLLTSRPDRLPIDLKRQGRAEVHIPLFYPHQVEEIEQMFYIMARKNKASFGENAVPEVDVKRNLSGADIESVVLAAKRATMADGRDVIERADLELALERFIPSAQGLEKELQELSAVLECTDRNFLPEHHRTTLDQELGRAGIQERCVAIRQILER